MGDEAYLDALSRYQGYRDAAYARTWDELHKEVPAGCDLKLMPIDDRALGYWLAIQEFRFVNAEGNFPWSDIFQQVRRTPRRFDIAIWDGQALCGMACGMVSRGRMHLTVKWLERFRTDCMFESPGLKGFVAELALTAADHYAAILGCDAVRLKNPLSGTEKLYDALGFVTQERQNGHLYLVRNV